MKVIGIVGYPASGKGEVSAIAEKRGVPVVVMGDMIRRAVTKAGLALTDDNIGAMARALRAELGMDAVAILTAREVENTRSETVIVDGIRGDAEVKYFKSVFSDFTLLHIDACFETRLARMQTRGRSDDTKTPETLRARDEREESFGLARAIALADARIENESTREAFEEKVSAFFGGAA
jgi:Dephospho-CoA kinase